MTVSSETQGSCQGDSYTTHRGQQGKSLRSEENNAKQDINHIDELSEEIAHVSLKGCRDESAEDSELIDKLEELSIKNPNTLTRKPEEKENYTISGDTSEEDCETTEVSSQLKLNITEDEEKKCNEKDMKADKKSARKTNTLDLNVIVDEVAKISIGNDKDTGEGEDEDAKKDGELLPRSPVRAEHANVRCEPYQGASRSRNHGSGGFCVAEATANYVIDQTNWTDNLNIPIHFPVDACYSSPPPYPFSYATSPSEYTDEGIYDVQSPEENCNLSKFATLEEQVDINLHDLFVESGVDTNELMERISEVDFDLSLLLSEPQIPESVANFGHASPECNGGSDYCPPSNSSGYDSLCSPRSTNSTPSPRSSLKGSQEMINVGCHEQAYGASLGYDTAFSIQASPMGIEHTECSSVQTSHQTQSFSPVYLTLPGPESRLGPYHNHMPETVVASKPKPLAPKPTFSKRSGKERMDEKMNKTKKKSAWARVSLASDDCLLAADADGDTQLMILLVNTPELEMIYALVERLRKIDGALTVVNLQGHSVLFLAAMHCPDAHAGLITRYIADTLLSIKAPLDTIYERGNTLLHCLCETGAKRYKALKELLTINKTQRCFNLDQFNDDGMTPLQVAVKSHKGSHLDCSSMVRLLIEAGANVSLLTRKEQKSALQLAVQGSCDPILINALLSSPTLAAMCRDTAYRQDTVLHLAAQRNDLPLVQQAKVYKQLLEQKAPKDARDSKGRLPWDLVAAHRKETMKHMIQQK